MKIKTSGGSSKKALAKAARDVKKALKTVKYNKTMYLKAQTAANTVFVDVLFHLSSPSGAST